MNYRTDHSAAGWRMKSVSELSSDGSVGAPLTEDTANSISSPVREVLSPCSFRSFRVLLLDDVGHCLCEGA